MQNILRLTCVMSWSELYKWYLLYIFCNNCDMFIVSIWIETMHLWYVSRRAIFGVGMGRDDGYYCDVLSSGVKLFIVEGSSFYSIHWSYRPRFISCIMVIITSSNIHSIGPQCCQHQTSTKQLYIYLMH